MISSYTMFQFHEGVGKAQWRISANVVTVFKISVPEEDRGKGVCSKIVDSFETMVKNTDCKLVIDKVLSRKLAASLKRRGYKKQKEKMPGVWSYVYRSPAKIA